MRNAEAQLQRMERILEISRELASTVSLKHLLHRILEAAVELTETESAGILLLDEGSGELRFVAATSFADQLAEIPVPVEGSIAGASFSSGEPVIVSDVCVDPRYYTAVEQRTGYEARSLLAVPLQFQERRIGVLEVENKHGDRQFDAGDVETLTVLSAQATVAIENARLVEELQRARGELEQRVEARTAELSASNVALRGEIADRQRAEEQLKASLQEKEVLLREIHHRVKNNLQVISALLEFQSEATTNEQARQALQESQNRIQSMARIHTRLYQSRDLGKIEMGGYIRDLMDDLRQSYGAYHVALQIDAADIAMDVDTAIPCGLIINELVSNSMKHAFPLERGRSAGVGSPVGHGGGPVQQTGEIRVTMRLPHADTFELVVRDNGIGLPDGLDPQDSRSLGWRLVKIFTRQLRGSLDLDRTGHEGMAFKITFPTRFQTDQGKDTTARR